MFFIETLAVEPPAAGAVEAGAADVGALLELLPPPPPHPATASATTPTARRRFTPDTLKDRIR